MNLLKRSVLTVLLLAVMVMPSGAVNATTTATTTDDDSNSSVIEALLERLQELLDRLRELQDEASDIRQEIRDEIKDGLEEGMSDEDIKKIQEILATDSGIYPEGLVTGYFGPLTKAALKRFQNKFKLEVTGTVNEETKEYLEELWQEKVGNDLPPGLLNAPGIQKKVELRIEQGCDNSGRGSAFLCQKIKVRLEKDDDEDEDDDDDEDEDEDDEEEDDEEDDNDDDDDDEEDDD